MMKAEREILESQGEGTLAEWWCLFNRWGWPGEMPNPEERTLGDNPRRVEAMDFISDKIGHKRCLREWNRDNMGDDEFEAWWRIRPKLPPRAGGEEGKCI